MVITLLTDFRDMYPASMKGVILGIAPGAVIVDISHSVRPHDIRAGAFMLMACARYFPSGTVHIAVVDPGVGTPRRAIAARVKSEEAGVHYFVGPDNGLLIPAARSIGKPDVYEITNKELFNIDVSSTFHGRDIFAPVGARISCGMNVREVGRQISDFVDMDFGLGEKKGETLAGRVIFIDDFGNIVTNIPSGIVDFQPGDVLEIEGKRVVFQRAYGFCRQGEPLVLAGSHGYLEIAVNRGSASIFFDKRDGDEISINNHIHLR